MICYNCQKDIAAGSRYCYLCGASQRTSTPSPPRDPGAPLRRSRTDKVIAGVCAGFAKHFNLDIALVRVIWLLVAVFGGGGVIAYVICWVVIPMEEIEGIAPAPAQQNSTS